MPLRRAGGDPSAGDEGHHVGGARPARRARLVSERVVPSLLGAGQGRGRLAGAPVNVKGQQGRAPEVLRRGAAAVGPAARERIVLGEGSEAERLGSIERVLAGLIPVIDGLGRVVAAGQNTEERPALADTEAWWTCSGCRKRLGIVNNAGGELRIRHDRGRFLYRIVSGAGGSTTTTCNSCGVENTLRDTG